MAWQFEHVAFARLKHVSIMEVKCSLPPCNNLLPQMSTFKATIAWEDAAKESLSRLQVSKVIPGVMTEEAVAIDVARQLLNEIQGLDREALAQVNIRLAQGKEALRNPKTSGTSSLLNEKEWSLLPELHEVWKIASEMKE